MCLKDFIKYILSQAWLWYFVALLVVLVLILLSYPLGFYCITPALNLANLLMLIIDYFPTFIFLKHFLNACIFAMQDYAIDVSVCMKFLSAVLDNF